MSLLLSQQSAVWAVTAALVEGADTLAAQVSPVVAASSAVTDGADVLQAQVGPVPAFTSASTDGADVLSAAIEVVSATDFSASLLDGADTLVALVALPTKLGGDDVPRVEIWTTRKAKAVRKRITRELIELKAAAPDLVEGLAVPAPQPDWSAYVAQLQAVAAQLEALQARRWDEWLEQDDEEILLLL